MDLPAYVTLFILMTVLFLGPALGVVLTTGLTRAALASAAKRRFAWQVGSVALVWVSFSLVLAYSNVLVPRADAVPALGILIVGATLAGLIWMARSKAAHAVLDAVPLHWLAAIQVYRVIGVVFLLLQTDGLLPAYFARSTGWGDVAVGVMAPMVAWLLHRDAVRYRLVGLAWCAAGIADLVLVLFKAVRSSPGPLQAISFDLPTVIIGYFPFPVIPLVIVPVSILLHVALIRRLLRAGAATRPVAAAAASP